MARGQSAAAVLKDLDLKALQYGGRKFNPGQPRDDMVVTYLHEDIDRFNNFIEKHHIVKARLVRKLIVDFLDRQGA